MVIKVLKVKVPSTSYILPLHLFCNPLFGAHLAISSYVLNSLTPNWFQTTDCVENARIVQWLCIRHSHSHFSTHSSSPNSSTPPMQGSLGPTPIKRKIIQKAHNKSR